MAAEVMNSKRKAIVDSNRTMFIWVAAMSALIGMCLVVAIFLVQQIMFKAQVMGAMTETQSTLIHNNAVTRELASNVVVLETDTALNAAKASDDEKALQVILDALPADRNALALGASLQQNLLTGIEGLTIESLSVDNASSGLASTAGSDTTIPITLQVSATNASSIKDMLTKLERSIRVIDIDTFTLERSDAGYQATISAHAYYEPPKTVQLTEKIVPEGSKK